MRGFRVTGNQNCGLVIFTLKTEGISYSETLVTSYKTTRCHNLENHNPDASKSRSGAPYTRGRHTAIKNKIYQFPPIFLHTLHPACSHKAATSSLRMLLPIKHIYRVSYFFSNDTFILIYFTAILPLFEANTTYLFKGCHSMFN
jgi:hypothetical protein